LIDVAYLPLNLPLRCRCGRVRGVASNVSPSSGFRFVCYCKDCQAFARFLKRPDVLDPAGGTDIFQMPPGRVKLLGPPLCRIYERSAVGPLPPNAPAPPSLGVFVRRASKIFAWWVLGLGRPSPLFDDRTNAPRAVPRVLTRNERADL
jgi:Family of unknown function (DUF6151)